MRRRSRRCASELAAAEENARTQRDLYLRAAAELDNVRKRAQRDIEQAHRYAIEGFAAELLPVRDSLELGGAQRRPIADAATLLAGQEATLKLLRAGVREVRDPPDRPGRPALRPESARGGADAGGGQCGAELGAAGGAAGYELNGRLLRPARVIVARASGGGSAAYGEAT